jgi:hypothetical protein
MAVMSLMFSFIDYPNDAIQKNSLKCIVTWIPHSHIDLEYRGPHRLASWGFFFHEDISHMK